MQPPGSLVLVIVCMVVGAEFSTSESTSGAGPGFLFTVPRVLRAGRRETACLSVHGERDPEARTEITVTIDSIKQQKNVSITKKTFETDNVGCFELRIPDITERYANLHVQLKFSESNYSSNIKKDVLILPSSGFMFIQTDKEIYKPGDRVKIRILLLSNDLGVPKNSIIPVVQIKNPISIAIGQWENVTTDLGLVQLEHQLSQETMLGTWSIDVPNKDISWPGNYKTFIVKEHMLPRFEVIIHHPESVYEQADSFNFTVCAKYSYGAAVKGTARLKISLFNKKSVNQIKELNEGCANFVFGRNETPKQVAPFALSYDLIATVIEKGTGQSESSQSEVKISATKYKLQFFNTPFSFQPGLPYKGQVKVVENLADLTNKTIRICYNLAIGHTWNLSAEQCGEFKLNEKQVTSFVIFPFEDNIVSIRIKASIQEDEHDFHQHVNNIYFSATPWFSTSQSYIHLSYEPVTPIKCKAWQKFSVLYTLNNTINETSNTTKNNPIVFNYLIKSKGNILKFGKMSHTPCSLQLFNIEDYENPLGNITNLKPKLPIDKFILTVKIHQKMFSEGQLLVYYVRDDGEVIGSSINFEVENCLANKVDAGWTDKQNYPGEETNFKIKAAAGSLCAVNAVDKKTIFMSPPVNLNMDILLEHIRKPRYSNRISSNIFTTLSVNHDDCKPGVSSINSPLPDSDLEYWDLRRRKRDFSMYEVQYLDTYQVFNEMDLLVMTDLDIITRPCWTDFYSREIRQRGGFFSSPNPSLEMMMRPDLHTKPYHVHGSDGGAAVRSHFPDTWLWDLVPIGRSGEAQFKRNMPHSITQWVSNVVCISPSAGVGIAQSSNITAFKPFFIDLLTPYALKRNEVSHLKVVIFNYLNHSLPVKIILELNQNIRLAGAPDESIISACIGPNDSITDTFRVTATALGKVNITITAEVDPAYPGECGPEILLNRKDVIVKTMQVQPEGFPFERTRANFACVNATNETTELKWSIELPFDTIQNSSRLKVILDNDFLELTTENLGSLLQIPTGCGEQIMANLAPNLYILRYLNATGGLTKDIEKKALNYIRIGYERILQHRHSDGSFSAFGEKYGGGSMFLTAFVMRTLSQASKYVFIDSSVYTKAGSWILQSQLENGCFLSVSNVFQSGMNDAGGDNVALTAYVLISLLESDFPISETVKTNAKFCLRGYNSADKYTMAIIAYALTLVEWHSEANRSLERLLEIATRQNNLLWWEDPESLSSSLEMTSYMIMSLIHANSSDHLALANGAIRWLLTKRNSNGGFVSTQDTVVALDALTKYALVAKREETNLTVSIATGGKQFSYRMKSSAKLRTKQISMSKFSNFVKFKLEGTGCILIQSVLRYNLPQIVSSEALKLAVRVSPVSTIDKCTMAQISPCLSYLMPEKKINMAVLEATLPSGYKADRKSLFELTNDRETKVEKFEEIDNKVILYFTKLDNNKICVPFLINEQTVVENRTDAIVRLYDYYNPEISASTSYQLESCNAPKLISD